jgi:hypothetical protein
VRNKLRSWIAITPSALPPLKRRTRIYFRAFASGKSRSLGYYAQVGWWPFGNAYVNGVPGDQGVTSIDTLSPGVDDSARDQAHVLHEVLCRAQVAF